MIAALFRVNPLGLHDADDRLVDHQPVTLGSPEVLYHLVSTVRAADYLGLGKAQLGNILGISPSTITRMYQGNYEIEEGSKPWEMAALLVRLYRGLDAIMAGDNNSLQSWMNSANKVLHGIPKQLIMGTEGLVKTVAYVDSSRARV